MIKHISDILIETIKEHYLTSPDYNGINASLLKNPELRDIEIRQEIAALVSDGLVGVLSNSFDTNPYINRFGFPDIEHQLAELQNAFMNCVLYPTSKLLASEIDNECTTPMEHHLRLGHPQLKVMFFEYDVLLIYALDPRFYFEFNDYSQSYTVTGLAQEVGEFEMPLSGVLEIPATYQGKSVTRISNFA